MIGAYDDRDGKIWFDGKLIEWRDANIHILTHAMHQRAATPRRAPAASVRPSRDDSSRPVLA